MFSFISTLGASPVARGCRFHNLRCRQWRGRVPWFLGVPWFLCLCLQYMYKYININIYIYIHIYIYISSVDDKPLSQIRAIVSCFIISILNRDFLSHLISSYLINSDDRNHEVSVVSTLMAQYQTFAIFIGLGKVWSDLKVQPLMT